MGLSISLQRREWGPVRTMSRLLKDFDGVTELLRQPACLDSSDSPHRKFVFHYGNGMRIVVRTDQNLVETITTPAEHKRREIVPPSGTQPAGLHCPHAPQRLLEGRCQEGREGKAREEPAVTLSQSN
jgi:hypothetical protein